MTARPTAAQIMRQAILAEDARKRARLDWWLGVAAHAAIGFFVVAGTIAAAIK